MRRSRLGSTLVCSGGNLCEQGNRFPWSSNTPAAVSYGSLHSHSCYGLFVIQNPWHQIESLVTRYYMSVNRPVITDCYNPQAGAYIHTSGSREFHCSRVRQFEASNKKLYKKASLTPQFTATNYQ